MDNGPFRMGNSTQGARNANRPSASQTSASEERPKTVTHRASDAGRQPEQKKGKRKVIMAIAGTLIVLVIAVACVWFFQQSGTAIDGKKYQAVFFTNGQVYFGKLQKLNNNYMKLTNIYYLQTKEASADSKNPQETSPDKSSDVELIKLGSEVHGPEDEMIINRDQMLFFENLKSDGKVANSIAQYQNKQ